MTLPTPTAAPVTTRAERDRRARRWSLADYLDAPLAARAVRLAEYGAGLRECNADDLNAHLSLVAAAQASGRAARLAAARSDD